MATLNAHAQSMLDLINRDRQRNRLSPVEWDAVAAAAGVRHAQDMAWQNYFSHWNTDGYGPDYRYTQAGGLDAISENIYTFYHRYSDGRPVPITDWRSVLEEAQVNLMQSPGHRRAILDPAHTHVGVGLAYAPGSGQIWLAQEFVGRYVRLDPLPTHIFLGAAAAITGRMSPGIGEPLINLAHAPFPRPRQPAELNRTGAYTSPAKVYTALRPQMAANNRFACEITLDHNGQTGLYHIRVWVQRAGQHQPLLASEVVIQVSTR
jgi:hypothetical protein